MRADLQFLCDLVRLAWRRWRCPRAHGDLIVLDDQLWVYCWRCGMQTAGIEIETAHVRRAWAFDRMRQRFRIRRAS